MASEKKLLLGSLTKTSRQDLIRRLLFDCLDEEKIKSQDAWGVINGLAGTIAGRKRRRWNSLTLDCSSVEKGYWHPIVHRVINNQWFIYRWLSLAPNGSSVDGSHWHLIVHPSTEVFDTLAFICWNLLTPDGLSVDGNRWHPRVHPLMKVIVILIA